MPVLVLHSRLNAPCVAVRAIVHACVPAPACAPTGAPHQPVWPGGGRPLPQAAAWQGAKVGRARGQQGAGHGPHTACGV